MLDVSLRFYLSARTKGNGSHTCIGRLNFSLTIYHRSRGVHQPGSVSNTRLLKCSWSIEPAASCIFISGDICGRVSFQAPVSFLPRRARVANLFDRRVLKKENSFRATFLFPLLFLSFSSSFSFTLPLASTTFAISFSLSFFPFFPTFILLPLPHIYSFFVPFSPNKVYSTHLRVNLDLCCAA